MMNAHKITAEFEKSLCEYTGAPYAVAVDNCSNALFLALYYELHVVKDYAFEYSKNAHVPRIKIPKHTYPSVACEIVHAGAKVVFDKDGNWPDGKITGMYPLLGTNIFDSALRFTCNMVSSGYHYCLSFTGPYKHLKLGKGGAILTDSRSAYEWFKRARFSGRQECSYHNDDFDQENFIDLLNEGKNFNVPPIAGWNFYMMPEIAARGLLLMAQFYDKDGNPKHNEDLCLPYPDLSKFKLWQ
jgi:dTDP-4-amino-4,6-dideoxygalactose transaminase